MGIWGNSIQQLFHTKCSNGNFPTHNSIGMIIKKKSRTQRNFHQAITLTHSIHWSLPTPTKNIRKPLPFFRGYRKNQ